MWEKKIAMFLIVFMVGSWCLYAETDDEASGLGPIAGTIAVVALIICVAAIIVDNSSHASIQPEDDSQFSDGLRLTSMAESQSVPENGFSSTLKALQHIDLGVTPENKTYVGLRFQF
jgi:hypothetical protein